MISGVNGSEAIKRRPDVLIRAGQSPTRGASRTFVASDTSSVISGRAGEAFAHGCHASDATLFSAICSEQARVRQERPWVETTASATMHS
jgi:hypothetical protein